MITPCKQYSEQLSGYPRFEKLIDIQQATTIEQFDEMLFKTVKQFPDFKLTYAVTGAGATVLAQAAEVGNATLIKHIGNLSEGNGLVDLGDMYGHTALHKAAFRSDLAAFQVLTDLGANLNIESTADYSTVEGYITKGTTPLWIAALYDSSLKSAKFLMRLGAVCKGNIFVPNYRGGEKEANRIATMVSNRYGQANL